MNKLVIGFMIFFAIISILTGAGSWKAQKVTREYIEESQTVMKSQYMDIKGLQTDTAYYRELIKNNPSAFEYDSLKNEIVIRDRIIIKKERELQDVNMVADSLNNWIKSLERWEPSAN